MGTRRAVLSACQKPRQWRLDRCSTTQKSRRHPQFQKARRVQKPFFGIAQFDSIYELTPASSRVMGVLTGDDEEGRNKSVSP